MSVSNELLAMFKKSIGDLSSGTDLDDYYTTYLTAAAAQLSAEDISPSALSSDLGGFAVVLCAQLIMDGKSTADNSTLILLRNLLSAQSKGERYDNG